MAVLQKYHFQSWFQSKKKLIILSSSFIITLVIELLALLFCILTSCLFLSPSFTRIYTLCILHFSEMFWLNKMGFLKNLMWFTFLFQINQQNKVSAISRIYHSVNTISFTLFDNKTFNVFPRALSKLNQSIIKSFESFFFILFLLSSTDLFILLLPIYS